MVANEGIAEMANRGQYRR